MRKALLATLPSSDTLEERDWRSRHRLLLTLLAWHVPALAVLGGVTGHGVPAVAAATLVPAACAALGHRLRHRRRVAAVLVTFGLVWCSAALVALTGGTIEAHFHFFVVIGFVAAYLDWLPLLFMIAFTVVSHVLGSSLRRDLIFSHPAGQANPWLWSLVHGVAVLAACAGIVRFWHVTEDVTERTALARRLADAEAGRRRFASDLLINLARRNQSMLHRQLAIIDQLAQAERDPATLAELFALDHLATRVRRNAESLLVLAGQQPPRVISRAVPIREVLRAAIVETENPERVLFTVEVDPAVTGHVVTDLTHLIAELVENAVRFSPPDSTVSLRARPDRMRDGGVLLTVEDSGVGMPAPQLAATNALLMRPPEVDLSVSQRLGFHVVARLAARHGIGVSVSSPRGVGLVATIELPATLFAATGGAAAGERRPERAASDEPATAATPLVPASPTAASPTAASPTTEPPSVEPRTAEPQTAEPRTVEPQTAGPQTREPQTAEPLAREPQAAESRARVRRAAVPRRPGGAPRTSQPAAPQPAIPQPAAPPAAAAPDGAWTGWWAADPAPTAADPAAAGPPRLDPPLVPSPRPRAVVTVPGAVPAADCPLDPATGLRKRIPQAHLAPGLRQPGGPVVPGPRHQARPVDRSATGRPRGEPRGGDAPSA